MTIVIPMAGHGQRFIDAGYQLPKYLLEAGGKSLLEWSVDSLPLDLASRTVFVALRGHEAQFQISERIRRLYGHRTEIHCVFLDQVTRGQSETVLSARQLIPETDPLIIFNIDTMFRSPSLRVNLGRDDVDGVLGCFPSHEPRFSFATTDANGRITRVTEKEPISSNALTGLYHYRRAGDFINAASKALRDNQLTKGEFYVAPLYNVMIARGANLILDHSSVHCILGTPQEYEAFRDFGVKQFLTSNISSPVNRL